MTKLLHLKLPVVTVFGKEVVLLGNDVSRHFPEPARSYIHPVMEYTREVGFFIISQLISYL